MVFVTESGPDDVGDVWRAGGGKEKNAEGIKGIIRRNFFETLKARAHWKAGDLHFFFGKIAGDQSFTGVIVSDEKVVTGRAGPGGIDFDRVGDDSDNGDAAPYRELSVNHVRVKRVGVNNQIRLKSVEQVGNGVLGLGNKG